MRYILLLLLCPSLAFAQGVVPAGTAVPRVGVFGKLVGSVSGALQVELPACETLRNLHTNSPTGSTICFDSAARRLIAQQFTASADYTVCRVQAFLSMTNGYTGDVSMEIWSDSGANLPAAKIGTASQTYAASTLSTNFNSGFYFDGINATLTNGALYWLVLRGSVTGSSTVHVRWARSSVSSLIKNGDSTGTTWQSEATGRTSRYILYSTAP